MRSGSSMDGEPGGFVDGDHGGVFIENFDRQIFSGGAERRKVGRENLDLLATAQEQGRFCGSAVDQDSAVSDPRLEPGATMLRELFLQEVVESFPGVGCEERGQD